MKRITFRKNKRKRRKRKKEKRKIIENEQKKN